MTTTAPTPAVRASTDMADAPDTARPAPAADAGAAASARPTLRSQVADNPLLSFFGALIVVLLSAAIASPHIRINDSNDRIDRLQATMEARFAAQDKKIDELDEKIDARFAELDEKIDARFAELDTRIDQLDARIDQLDLKLTALIAALQMTGVVDAALEGSVDLPAPEDPDSPSTSDAP